MALTRYENIKVNTVTAGIDSIGQQTTTITLAFQTRALVQDVRDSMIASKDDRAYTKQVRFVVNYTPNTQNVSINQYQYSINWRNKDYKLLDVLEANDRMTMTFVCYRNDPITSV